MTDEQQCVSSLRSKQLEDDVLLLKHLRPGCHKVLKCFSEVISTKPPTHLILLMSVNTNLISCSVFKAYFNLNG